jgi:large repetitive protein
VIRQIAALVAVIAVATACAADEPELGTTTQAAVVNGSFETGDYSGWTLLESPAPADFGTFAIVGDGQTIAPNEQVFDFFDGVFVTQFSPGMPTTYTATDGVLLAVHLQNGGQNHRMFQTVELPACQALVRWDMMYRNHNAIFDPTNQFFAVHLRDPSDDTILATPYKTTQGIDPLVLPSMTAFEVDVSAFAGQTVRLDFEHQVFSFHFDIAWDQIRIACAGPALTIDPIVVDFGNQRVGTASAPVPVRLRNTGGLPLTITAISIDPPFAVAGVPALPVTLPPGADFAVDATFTPVAIGPAGGSLAIESDATTGSPTHVALSGLGVAPAIAVDPAALDFGTVRVGASALRSITVTNPGSDTLEISEITITAPFALQGVGLPLAIAPGASVTLDVTFTPTTLGAIPGVLTIDSDAATSPTSISLAGAGVAPAIAVDPTSLAYGTVRVGTTQARDVTITNTGTDTLAISSITASGSAAFQLVDPAPILVAPGGSLVVTVDFTPPTVGSFLANVTIVSDAATSPTVIPLTGTGVAPAIAVDPSALAFGSVRTGTTASRVLTISNPGSDTLTISALTIAAPFAITATAPLAIPPGGSVATNVTFTPAGDGPVAGNLVIASDAPGPITVALTGTGVAPAIAVDPGSLDHGEVRVGTSADRSITITNPGTDVLTISAITAGGPFNPVAPTPTAIAPGASVLVTVRFTPPSATAFVGSLTIVSDAATSPTTVALAGTGIEPLIAVDPGVVAFGNRRVGVAGPTKLATVANPGTADLTIFAVMIGAPFAIVGPATPVVVPRGGSVAIEIAFLPTATGPFSESLTIHSDAGPSPSIITVTGTGTEPGLMPSTTAVGFGLVKVGTTSAPQPVRLTNTGDAPALVSAATVPPPFALTGPLPVSLLPGASVELSITFSPTADGEVTGQLAIASDAPALAAITLAGIGGSPTVVPSSTSLELGEVAVGTLGEPQLLELTNPSTTPLEIAAITVSEPFTRTSLVLPAVIPPGGSLSVGVLFAPVAAGPASGTLAIVSDGGMVVVPLAGTGVDVDEPPAAGGCCSAHGGGGETSALLAAALLAVLLRRGRRSPLARDLAGGLEHDLA